MDYSDYRLLQRVIFFLNFLKNNDSIIIKEADKGGCVVIMNSLKDPVIYMICLGS